MIERALWRAAFWFGVPVYALSGWTPPISYRAMRHLAGLTDGTLNYQWLERMRRRRPAQPSAIAGFLGAWSVAELRAVAATVDTDGIAILARRLPAATCDALTAFARATPAMPLGRELAERYDSDRAIALRYDFAERDLLAQREVAAIVFDGTFAAIAAAYFGALPAYDFTTMWWTTARGPKDYAKAAQQYHYDLDRLFFLKFFIYLTDVTPESGPHVFVTGSHRSKPESLRAPRRYSDAEVERGYASDRIQTICAPRGTIFVADTRGLHKGLPVVAGERLVLQVEFAISRFGQNYRSTEVRARDLAHLSPDRRVFRNVSDS